MLYINNPYTDAWFNLAAEEYLLKNFSDDIFMLWQNEPSVIIGKHQNVWDEINRNYIQEKHIKVVRRYSGGGAVYHDSGNLNITFIQNSKELASGTFTARLIAFLATFGIRAEADERQALTIDGLKISGSAQCIHKNRVMYHCTLLFSANLDVLHTVLKGKSDELESIPGLKNIRAVPSTVVNGKYLVKTEGIKSTEEYIALVNFLLQSELPGGGWTLMGSNADSDITGMTLQALAPYYHKSGYENVTAAIDRGLNKLSEMQNDSGGYSTMGVETEESCAQIITALCSLGIDPETDSRFIKGGHWTIENLLSYHIDGSGFMHVKAGAGNNGGAAAGTLDGMATEQGYYALVAYQRLKDGKTSLYDMSDVSIKKGGKGDGSGTGLKEPTPIPTPTPVPATTPSGGNTKTPGGSGKSLGGKSSGSKSSTGSESSGKDSGSGSKDSKNSKSKNSKSSKDKNSGGWDFEAEPYTESEETSQMDTGEDGYQETAGESGTGSLTSKKKEYGMIFGFAAAGALAGGLAFAATTGFSGFLQRFSVNGVDTFRHRYNLLVILLPLRIFYHITRLFSR